MKPARALVALRLVLSSASLAGCGGLMAQAEEVSGADSGARGAAGTTAGNSSQDNEATGDDGGLGRDGGRGDDVGDQGDAGTCPTAEPVPGARCTPDGLRCEHSIVCAFDSFVNPIYECRGRRWVRVRESWCEGPPPAEGASCSPTLAFPVGRLRCCQIFLCGGAGCGPDWDGGATTAWRWANTSGGPCPPPPPAPSP